MEIDLPPHWLKPQKLPPWLKRARTRPQATSKKRRKAGSKVQPTFMLTLPKARTRKRP